jgi:geranylgeranyl pyrophosphate synthase
MLDFTSDSISLGKAALADLKEGNVTGPVLFAI